MLRDRVACGVSAAPGTGDIALGGAVAGFRTFAASFPSGSNLTAYLAADGTAFETGHAVYDSATNKLVGRIINFSTTGAILALSSSAIIRCSPTQDEFVETWPFLNVYVSTGVTYNSGFRTLAADVVAKDTHNGWDGATYEYVVPAAGAYEMLLNMRFVDGTAANLSHGLAVHTSNSDGAWMIWYATSGASRQGSLYTRQAFFNKGDRLRPVMYFDQGSQRVENMSMSISRLR